MAMNISAERTRREVMGYRLADLGDAHLVVDCHTPRCPRNRSYAIREIAREMPDVTVMLLTARLRCATCQGRIVYARLQTVAPPDYPQGEWVTLIGELAKGPGRG